MIAYFAMEIGLEGYIATYGGGLGILAGDTLLSFADLGVPAVAVTLLYKGGYLHQRISSAGEQIEQDTKWDWSKYLKKLDLVFEVPFSDKTQRVACWEYVVRSKGEVRVFFLDADLEGNDPEIRRLNHRLYLGDGIHRLRQEILLGIGGYRLLKALGYQPSVYHMNESHSAFLVVELLRELGSLDKVRRRCVFTPHTPVPVGHDKFPLSMVQEELKLYNHMDWEQEAQEGHINLSHLAIRYSGYVNAVSFKHMFVSRNIFPDCQEIDFVTNGVHHRRWIHEELRELFDRYIPSWDTNPNLLQGVHLVPSHLLYERHQRIKQQLVNLVNKMTDASFSDDVLTIGVARRITPYKRNDLILRDIERLIRIAESCEGLQIVFAGKAHPRDEGGKAIIRNILEKALYVKNRTKRLKIAFLENYGIEMAKLLVSGCDVWLNNPRRPLEACGTSGMKAGMNGVLNFSTWDGWWLEGGIEGVNGWGIGPKPAWQDMSPSDDEKDAEDLYNKLLYTIIPTYYRREEWLRMMKNSIATVGSYFNTHRMVNEYLSKIYIQLLR
ncbi:MAG: alpha-glucan family phosphorylase [Aquificaceae bacterium]|nr:alpha-glucan family phosphorylase [Aquificaceae bacterium]